MQRLLAVAVAATLVLAGCGGKSEKAAAGTPGSADEADRTVEIRLQDSNRYDPEKIEVKVGETITFKVVNDGKQFHDFFLGDETEQKDREEEMADMGSEPMVMDDEPGAVTVDVGESKEITWKFTSPGTFLYGCHQPSRYAKGMKGTITVA